MNTTLPANAFANHTTSGPSQVADRRSLSAGVQEVEQCANSLENRVARLLQALNRSNGTGGDSGKEKETTYDLIGAPDRIIPRLSTIHDMLGELERMLGV